LETTFTTGQGVVRVTDAMALPMGSPLSAADRRPLLEPPGFLMRNYGRGTPITTLLAHIAMARSSAGSSRSPADGGERCRRMGVDAHCDALVADARSLPS
jgi:hypothetical protein